MLLTFTYVSIVCGGVKATLKIFGMLAGLPVQAHICTVYQTMHPAGFRRSNIEAQSTQVNQHVGLQQLFRRDRLFEGRTVTATEQ